MQSTLSDSARGPQAVDRRTFLRYGSAAGVLAGIGSVIPRGVLPAQPGLVSLEPAVLGRGDGPIDVVIGETPVRVDGRMGRAVTINGTLPGPTLRFREGDEAVIRVTNELDEDTSVHWHGILLPNGMDGVPKVTFPGIRPGETFEYRYRLRQYGTYWYHSHSGLQEQLGHYGAYVVDPADPEPFTYDRDYVVVLSDWTFENPYRILARLRKQPDYYNFQKRTVGDFIRDAADHGFFSAVGDRLSWGGMRMSPTDISDVTGATYTYLVNGMGPESNWTGLFEPGERVRLRFINAATASYFDVRMPGLPMTVVQASGQHVEPTETDELRIAIAETFDVIVEPREGRAYTIFAEAMDRSGFARGTLAPGVGMEAGVPTRRPRPTLTMADMGMADMGGMHMGKMDTTGAGDAAKGATGKDPMGKGGMAGHEHDMPGMSRVPAMSMRVGDHEPGAIPPPVMHGPDHHGPENAATPMTAKSRLDEPGLGLGDDGWRVLRYTDLKTPEPRDRLAPPEREIEIHLTGNMERFIWGMDGKTFSEAQPIRMRLGERLRLTMVNDTMMNHPMHLHGMWMELENGAGAAIPRVHTVNVKPAERVCVLVTADAPGRWAFHCHILYHMDVGMFRVVEVVDEPATNGEARP